MTRRIRHVAVGAAAAILLAVGCTSSDDGAATAQDATTSTAVAGGATVTSTAPATVDDSGSSTTSPAGATYPDAEGPAPGVTDDAVRVGITYVDLEAVAGVGIDLDHGDYEAAYDAAFAAVNDAGGVHGRLLEPVFASVNPIGPTPAEEACVRLVEDEEVFLVVGFGLDEGPLCYLETYGVPFLGGQMTDERLSRSGAAWLTIEPSGDLQVDTLVAYAEQGHLDETFAVFAIDQAFLDDTVLPALAELGAEPAATAVLEAAPDDTVAQVAETQIIAQRFEAEGATTVLVVGNAGPSWGAGIEDITYRPRVLATDQPSMLALLNNEDEPDTTILEGALVGGQFGPQDAQFAEPAMQDCLAMLAEAGIEARDPATLQDGDAETHVSAFAACRYTALLTALLEAAGPNLNHATVQLAADSLGEVQIPGFPDPFTFGPGSAADGDPRVYLYEYDAAAADFVIPE